MRIVFLGSGAFAVPTLRRLAGGEHDVALVLTQPARAGGRGLHATPTPVKIAADELRLRVIETDDVNATHIVGRIRSLEPRLMLVIAFGQMLGRDLLTAAPGGAINLHASLLPKYRGAAPIHWAVVNGERETGNTVFRIVKKMDAGPILTMNATPIDPNETTGELHDRLARLGVGTVLAALRLFEDAVDPPGRPQIDAKATFAPKVKKSDGIVDFAQPVRRVHDRIRGMTPWPGAVARFASATGARTETVTIVRARVAGDSSSPTANPGVVTDSLRVATADGTLEIVEIKPASGRAMSWNDFVNGRRVRPGDRFAAPADDPAVRPTGEA